MKEACRICARELCGNQRRWLFHPAGRLRLQVLLSHALRRDVQRDGRPEFICSKCCFMLERMFRFDAVMARVQALSLERLRRLLQERERLRQCISALYSKNNALEISGAALQDAQYCALLQEDLTYCMYESWAEDEEITHNPLCCHGSRRCRLCRALRVSDSDYEAVCKVPRRALRSVSCGPSTRHSASADEEQTDALLPESQRTPSSLSGGQHTPRDDPSSSGSLESLDKSRAASPVRAPQSYDSDAPPARVALALLQDCVYRPVQSPRGSRLPVLMNPVFLNGRAKLDSPEQEKLFDGASRMLLEPELELARLEELWLQEEYLPIRLRRIPKVKHFLKEQ